MMIPYDVIAQLHESGNWILYNVFTLDAVAVSPETPCALSMLNTGKKVGGEKFLIWEIGSFSNDEGLLADPTRMVRDFEAWPGPRECNITELVELLEKYHIVVKDDSTYQSIFAPKTSLLDSKHRGNFHQELGQKLLIEKRVNPEEWWVEQKFSSDLKSLNNTLYKAVQEKFLKAFFQKRFNKAHSILDIGCGIGYYTNMMGAEAATVVGIDPNPNYVEIAKKNVSENVSFNVSTIGSRGSLDWIESERFNYVFMSDALLYYFVSPDPKVKPDINVLFSDIKRILKKGGRFISIEPHGVFWLRPWLGAENRPFTVLTEYRTKRFNVTPNYTELLKSFIEGGFIIQDMLELYASEEFEKINRRAECFACEFPLWWFFELEPKNR